MNNFYNVIITIFTIIISMGMVQYDTQEQKQALQFPLDKLQQGDIAFRRGEGFISEVVVYNDAHGMYSHIGIIVKHNDSLKVVHAVPGEPDFKGDFDRVKLEPIESFYSPSRASKGEIMRIPLSDSMRNIINNIALEKAHQKIKFDHDYNVNDTTKLYCTELIQLLFSHIDIDLAENRSTVINIPGASGNYIMPSDIYRNEKLISVYKY
ncbi:MAG: hypothetical protein IJN66_04885 [Muribaculaceae bacterium]|nr:hypothetical protein [Muribaculaceae bacterium]